MTNEEIDALQIGSELDRLIHEKVFGRRTVWRDGEYIGTQIASDGSQKKIYGRPYYIDPDDTTLYLHVTDGFTGMIPRYSTQIQDAWRVVDELHLHVGWYDLGWYASTEHDFNEDDCLIVFAETMPMAVCRLALKKVAA